MTQSLIALALATAVLVAIPGPNVALIVANSLQFGLRAGCATVFGTTLGVAVQLALVAIGMTAIIELAVDVLVWVKWGGVVYLVWLGIKTWHQPAADLGQVVAAPTVFWRGFMIAAINPKTLLFNAAFLPQFVASNPSSWQPLTVAAVYLVVIIAGDMLWAVFATSARPLLSRATTFRHRLTGGFLVTAALGLALSRRV